MSDRPPVSDWTSDWDHTDEAWANDPFPIWDELRSGCPLARTERYGGGWLPTRHEDISAIAYDTDKFTLANPAAVTWSHSQVRGPRTLPVDVSASV